MARALDVPVRTHLVLGAGLVALAALWAGLGWLFPFQAPPYAMLAFALLGVTSFVSGIACWYLPSFAKRAVTPRALGVAFPGGVGLAALALALHVAAEGSGVASHGLLGALLVASNLTAALVLLWLPLLLAVSALAGPAWRGGVPFWRAPGTHRPGDLAAAAGFASALLWMLLLGARLALAYRSPPDATTLLGWSAALLVFVLAGLAHLLPRGRGVPLAGGAFLATLLPFHAGLVLLALERASALPLLGLWLAAGALALAIPAERGGKPLGPRLRQATPLLLAALLSALGAALCLALSGRGGFFAPAGSGALAATLVLALAGLSLLTLPVLFNQRPDPRLPLPAALLGGVGGLVVAASGWHPPLLRFAVPLLILSVLLWLASLWPLRRPRRECPPDEAEPS